MESRTQNTKRNIIASYALMLLQVVFSFVSKSAIIYSLGSEYLGISSLFNSVLTVLNVAELGFTTSVVFFMYKPIADNDNDRVCALLAYLRQVYRYVGIAILTLGIFTGIFLPFWIHGDVPKDINVYVVYILYLINTAISYFLAAHKTALLTAVQRLDLTKLAGCVVTVVQYIFQLISLICFHNYYMFVGAMILGTALTNVFAAYISKRKFPQFVCKGTISNNDKKEILNKVKGLLICNISIVTYSTLDNIVISSFIGLTAVAIYSNYMTIYKAVNQLVVMIRSAMQASVGNSVAKETLSKNLYDVYQWQFLFSIIATWCATCMMCLYQPFMKMWMGKDLLLPLTDVILIVVWFSIDIVQQAHFLYITGSGLWNELRYSYIFNTCFNLLLNFLLGKLIGITGVLIASLVTCIISGTFWQCIIIFKCYFKSSAKRYILIQLKYLFFSTIIVAIAYEGTSLIVLQGIIDIVVKFVVCTIMAIALIILLYHKEEYFDNTILLLKRIIKKRG